MSLCRFALWTATAALIATTGTAQEADRWRYDPQPEGDLAVAYGGTEGEDTWIYLSCVYEGVTPEVEAYVVVQTEGFAEGTTVPLTFYGPAWSVSMDVVVDGPGLYKSVTARFGFGPEDQLYRSTFTNVGLVNYRLRADMTPERADFSQGRTDLLAFMADCEQSGTEDLGTADAVLQP